MVKSNYLSARQSVTKIDLTINFVVAPLFFATPKIEILWSEGVCVCVCHGGFHVCVLYCICHCIAMYGMVRYM